MPGGRYFTYSSMKLRHWRVSQWRSPIDWVTEFTSAFRSNPRLRPSKISGANSQNSRRWCARLLETLRLAISNIVLGLYFVCDRASMLTLQRDQSTYECPGPKRIFCWLVYLEFLIQGLYLTIRWVSEYLFCGCFFMAWISPNRFKWPDWEVPIVHPSHKEDKLKLRVFSISHYRWLGRLAFWSLLFSRQLSTVELLDSVCRSKLFLPALLWRDWHC